MKKDNFIVPVNDLLVSERFKTMRQNWLKWKKSQVLEEKIQEQSQEAEKIKSTDYYFSSVSENKDFEEPAKLASKKLEQLEKELANKYGISRSLTFYENGSNPITTSVLNFAVETYNKPELWFLYGDLKDYIYYLLNPDRKIMRVTKLEAEKLSFIAKERNLDYGNDEALVVLAQEILDFPEITPKTDILELKDTMPDVLKIYKLISLKSPETKVNTETFLWSLRQENKYRNEFDQETAIRAYFEELENYRILPSQFRTFPIMIVIRAELTKRNINMFENMLENKMDIGHTESGIRKYLENERKNLKNQIEEQKVVIEYLNQNISSSGRPWGEQAFVILNDYSIGEMFENESEEIKNSVYFNDFKQYSFIHAIWLIGRIKHTTIPEKYKNL